MPDHPKAIAESIPFEPIEFLDPGQIVTLARPYNGKTWRVDLDTPLVVIADSGRKVRVAALGGSSGHGRYLSATRQGLVKRDVTWLAEQIAAGWAG